MMHWMICLFTFLDHEQWSGLGWKVGSSESLASLWKSAWETSKLEKMLTDTKLQTYKTLALAYDREDIL